MFFRKFVWLFALVLLFGALFASSRRHGAYQDGYAQGYLAGQQSISSEGETTTVVPPPAPVSPAPQRGFGFLGGLFTVFLLFFGFMLFISFMGLLFGRKQGRRHGRHWHSWQKDWHGHKPYWHDDELKDEPIMKA